MKRLLIAFAVIILLAMAATNGFAFPKNNPGKGSSRQSEIQQMPESMRQQMAVARDAVVARVNGAPITMGAVLKMMQYIARQSYNPNPDMEEIKKDTINRLILQELIYQIAKKEGIVVDKKRIDDSIAGLKISLGGEEGFKRYLKREMVSEEELRAEIERKIIVEKRFQEEVLDKVTISEEELRDYYKKNINRFRQNENMIITDIVFILDQNKEESMNRAKGVLKILKDDPKKDLSRLTEERDLIIRDLEIKDEKDIMREKEIYDVAKGLKVGEISDAVKMSDSIHILILKSYTPKREFTYEEVKDTIFRELKNEALTKRLKEWEGELKKEARIEIIEIKENK